MSAVKTGNETHLTDYAAQVRERIRVYPEYFTRPDQLSEEYREYLLKILTVQVSSEYQERHRRPVPPAPEWIEDVGIQFRGETEHGLGLVDIIRSLGVDPCPYIQKAQTLADDSRLLDVFKRQKNLASDGVVTTDEVWIDVGIGRWLIERGGGYQSMAAIGSTYIPWAIWSARNFRDEGFEHSNSGKLIVRAAIEKGLYEAVQEKFDRMLPYAVDMFGANDAPNGRRFIELGIKTIGNRETRLAWLAHLKAEAKELGVKLPANPLQGHRGDYSI